MAEQADGTARRTAGVSRLVAARGGFALDLHIEELVLRGFPPAARHAIAAAVERELSRLFAEGGLPGSLAPGDARNIFRLDAGSFAVPHDASPDLIGARVAAAIHRSLGGESDSGRTSPTIQAPRSPGVTSCRRSL
jgi:hypothetical protein